MAYLTPDWQQEPSNGYPPAVVTQRSTDVTGVASVEKPILPAHAAAPVSIHRADLIIFVSFLKHCQGKVWLMIKLAHQRHKMAMARPRILVGKISERITHTTGPTDIAKQAM